jgi:3-isopropylmalate dehydrogenase
MARTHKIAVIGGDGTGPEVVAEGVKVLAAAAETFGFDYETTEFDYGGDRYLAKGGDPNVMTVPPITDAEVDELRAFDAIFLGAVGHPKVRDGILEPGLLLKLRFDLDQYINLRPVKLFPGVPCPLAGKAPEDIDFVIVRENTEGLYSGMGGAQYVGTPHEVATQVMCNTRHGVERAVRYAFEYCKKRGAGGRLTLVYKTNVLTRTGDLWYRTFMEVGREYPDIEKDYNHVDACCMWMVKNPEYYDTIVVGNMFGDIITDLGAMIQGGMGIAAGGNINPEGVSMFEPIGGSAPKYTGQGKINPLAAIGACAMMLETLGEDEAAKRVNEAIAYVTGEKLEGMGAGRMGYSTSEVGDLVAEAVAKK